MSILQLFPGVEVRSLSSKTGNCDFWAEQHSFQNGKVSLIGATCRIKRQVAGWGVCGEQSRYIRDILCNLIGTTEKSLFGMFKGFMDEAGITSADKVCVVAGFVADGPKCDRAGEKWKKAVKPLGEFHSREFFPRNPDGTMTGVYKHLDVSVAESCAINLIDILAAGELEPIGMAIDSKTFLSLSPDERRWMTSATVYNKTWPSQGAPNHPWFTCFHYCVTQSNGYTPEGEQVYLTFDRQDTYEGNAVKIYNQLKEKGGKWGAKLGETVLFSSRTEAPLLQAADLLAFVIPRLIMAGNIKKIGDPVIVHALKKIALEKDYVRAMDVRAIDQHLQACPFRKTFWEGLSDPDLLEQVRAQGLNVLAVKTRDSVYATHHIRRNRVKVVQELDVVPLAGSGDLNMTDRRDDSTINIRESGENSVGSLQPSQKTSYLQEDKPK